jgi:hypothetical protein
MKPKYNGNWVTNWPKIDALGLFLVKATAKAGFLYHRLLGVGILLPQKSKKTTAKALEQNYLL